MADINKIKKEFIRIRDLGFVPSIAKYALSERNDGDAGETFQYYLSGIGRDNSKFADFDKWEVKTKRDTSTSATSLFSNAPSYPKNGDRVMLEKWGIPHEKYPNKLKLNTSLYANRFSKVHVRTKNVPTYKMKIKNDRDQKKIFLIVCDENENLLDDTIYWSHDLIEDRVNNKLKNTILIDVSEKIIDDKIHFKYNSAQLLLGSTLNSFLDCIDKGIIRYDSKWDVDTKGKHAGEEHNHGGGFRFHKGYNLLNLASEIIDI